MPIVKRVVVTGAAVAGLFASTVAPAAAAADDSASCVGLVASTLAAEGSFDIRGFKDIAAGEGTKNFGQFVAGSARLHEGSVARCLGA